MANGLPNPEDYHFKGTADLVNYAATGNQWAINELAARGYNPQGVKELKWQSQLDENGNIKPQYQLSWGQDVNPNTQAIEELRKRALATGPSAWSQLATQQQGLEEQGLKNATQRQASAAQAQARSSLASKYGLSSAAQERLAKSGMREQMAGLQNVGFQGAQARGNIGLQDEQMRQQMLTSLPGMENQLAQIGLQNKQGNLASQQFNIQNSINENNAKRLFDTNQYNEGMKAWAAKAQGDAMAGGGGGGSWICTEVHKTEPFSPDDIRQLMKLRKYALKNHEKEARLYLYEFAPLISCMKENKVPFGDHIYWLDEVMALSRQDKMEEAYKHYQAYIYQLAERFWPIGQAMADSLTSEEGV